MTATPAEPETAAGRALVERASKLRPVWPFGAEDRLSSHTIEKAVLEIEAELRRSLAEKARTEIAAFRRFHVRGPEEGADSEDVFAAGLIDDIETSLLPLIEGTDPASPEAPDHAHYWIDAPDDETGWHCTICGVTEYPGMKDELTPNDFPAAATPVAGSTIPPSAGEMLVAWKIADGNDTLPTGWTVAAGSTIPPLDVERLSIAMKRAYVFGTGTAGQVAAEYARLAGSTVTEEPR